MRYINEVLARERGRIVRRLRAEMCENPDCLDPSCLNYQDAIDIVSDGLTLEQVRGRRVPSKR